MWDGSNDIFVDPQAFLIEIFHNGCRFLENTFAVL